MLNEITKYERTPHIEGSRLQPGDTDEGQMKIRDLHRLYPGCRFVSEEKLDGANCGLSFSMNFNMHLQSRGHYLSGGSREKQFSQFKVWSSHFEDEILDILEDRYIMFGEWCAVRHSIFYDNLPHLFHEFDIYDRVEGKYLSTLRRDDLLKSAPVLSVPVLQDTWPSNLKEMSSWVGPSLYRTADWRTNLMFAADRAGLDPHKVLAESGASLPDADLAEGLYIKIENDDHVVARLKYVRSGFLQTILDSGTHWSQRPMIMNTLAPGVDIFARPDRMMHDGLTGQKVMDL